MNLDFVVKNTEIDEATRSFAERQLGKVLRFLEEPIEVRFRLEADKYRRIADLHIGHRFGVIQATDETGDMREGIRLAVEKAERQAKKSRRKHKDKQRRKARMVSDEWPLEFIDPDSLLDSQGPTVIESRTFAVKTMNLEEAAAKMQEVDLGFYVFRHDENGRVAVLYKRRDDTLGLLSPEL